MHMHTFEWMMTVAVCFVLSAIMMHTTATQQYIEHDVNITRMHTPAGHHIVMAADATRANTDVEERMQPHIKKLNECTR